jgi:hypothetical protein
MSMSSRQFTDSQGVSWRVWSTIPSPASLLSADYARGWLTFDAADRRKRLAPIPKGWESATPERMELMCRAAEEVSIHTGPIPQMSKELADALPEPDAEAAPPGPPNQPPRTPPA